jgi:hypothetical protein
MTAIPNVPEFVTTQLGRSSFIESKLIDKAPDKVTKGVDDYSYERLQLIPYPSIDP